MYRDVLKKFVLGIDVVAKIAIVGLTALMFFLDYCFGWPAPGYTARHLHRNRLNTEIPCVINNYALYESLDSISISYVHLFLNGKRNLYYEYHLLYGADDENQGVFLSYKLPVSLDGGRDQNVDRINFLIEENDSLITINYDKEPVGGFVLENPFGKEIVMKLNRKRFVPQNFKKEVCFN